MRIFPWLAPPILLAACAALSSGQSAAQSAPAAAVEVFYAKQLDASGIPIIASARVPDAALNRARAIVLAMLARRPDL
ncbi:MAG TPA: hypothetical protein VF655_02000, partial [Allosphingosinicella sp.]